MPGSGGCLQALADCPWRTEPECASSPWNDVRREPGAETLFSTGLTMVNVRHWWRNGNGRFVGLCLGDHVLKLLSCFGEHLPGFACGGVASLDRRFEERTQLRSQPREKRGRHTDDHAGDQLRRNNGSGNANYRDGGRFGNDIVVLNIGQMRPIVERRSDDGLVIVGRRMAVI